MTYKIHVEKGSLLSIAISVLFCCNYLRYWKTGNNGNVKQYHTFNRLLCFHLKQTLWYEDMLIVLAEY